jgi:hypothetical protein
MDPTLATQVQGSGGKIHENDASEYLEPCDLQLPSCWCVPLLSSITKDRPITPFQLGCCISIGDLEQAQKLLDDVPTLLNKKIGGKDLPTEVLIRKKREFAHWMTQNRW